MRKLGQGQSVVFCVPKEIEQKIRMQQGSTLSAKGEISVSDVICWVISETCLDLRRMVPLWLMQGARFHKHKAIWDEGIDLNDDHASKAEWAKRFLEDEAQSLDVRYRLRATDSSYSVALQQAGPRMGPYFVRRCSEFGLTSLRTSLQEEQERELSPEAVQERQIEPPPKCQPRRHSTHKDLLSFIQHGEFPSGFSGFRPAFWALGDTSAAKHLDVRDFPNHVWVTSDFYTTVQTAGENKYCSDLFQRPVHWVLTSKPKAGVLRRLVVISPYEAHELIPTIETSNNITLHSYAPRHNLGFQPLDHLSLYSVPESIISEIMPPDFLIQLNIFAGQLYMSSFKEYINVCDGLGLAWSPPDDDVILGPDGFIPLDTTGLKLLNKSGFARSPVKFLKVFITNIRRNRETIERTHIGKILDGVLLLDSDFN